MAITGQSASVYQGNRRVLRFFITDEDTVGSPAKSLSGLKFKFALAKFDATGNPIKKNPIIDMNSDNDPTQMVVFDEPNGVFDVVLIPGDTSSLAAIDYYFELEAFDASNNGVVTSTGTLSVLLNVNNA